MFAILHSNFYHNHQISITRVYSTVQIIDNMFTFFISTLTNLNDEFILDSSRSNVIVKKYRAYVQQQHARYETLRNQAFSSSVIQITSFKKKSFYVKVMKNKSNLFSEDSYAKWIQYVWEMKNQFDMNQVNDYVKKFDKTKLFFVVIFLKRETNAQLLWSVKVKSNSNQKYIWKKYVDFLKKNIKRVFIRKQNNFEKYRNYKQQINQSIRNYDAHRIFLVSDLHSSMKFSLAIELQNFVLNLTQNNQNFLAKQSIENNKNEILKRLKYREDNERKKKRNVSKNKFNDDYNKRKKNDENFDADRDNNQNQFNRNRRRNRKSDKKFKSDNSNRESINDKKLWRWIKIEYKNIMNNNKCIDCDKSECNIKNCKNIKSNTRSYEKTFRDSKSKK